MKFFLYIIFICIVVLSSCQSKYKGQETIYTKQLKKSIQISLPIDENTYFVSRSIFQFEENGREYLFFENREKRMYDFVLFDLKNQKEAKRIPIEREGPNGIPAMKGSRPFPDSNTFLVFQHNISRISLLEGNGHVIKNYPIRANGKFVDANLSSIASWPTFSRDSVVYFNQYCKGRGSRIGYDRIPLFASLDLRT